MILEIFDDIADIWGSFVGDLGWSDHLMFFFKHCGGIWVVNASDIETRRILLIVLYFLVYVM